MTYDQTSTRRGALVALAAASGSVALGMPKIPVAQDALDVLPDRLAEATAWHTEVLEEARRSLEGEFALEPGGLQVAMESLLEQGADDYSGFDTLQTMLARMNTADDLGELYEELQQVIRDTSDALMEVEASIVAVLLSSTEYAQTKLSGVDYKQVSLVIAHDVRGAIDGAALGHSLAGQRGAVLGAMVAGAAGSIVGFFDSWPREARRRDA